MKANQYTTLDALLLSTIDKAAPAGIPFAAICASAIVSREVGPLAEKTGRQPFRIVDGRLQALRKKGLIWYDTLRGWLPNKDHEERGARN